MNVTIISILASFINRHADAWKAFCEVAPNAALSNFGFVQDKGAWVGTDKDGGSYAFREYCGKIVALITPETTVLFMADGSILSASL